MKSFIILFSILLANSLTAQELISFNSASTSPNYSDPNINNVSLLNPGSGITAVGCGTWLSATGYNQSTIESAIQNGDYWDFSVDLVAGKEIFITNITIEDVYSNLSSGSIQKFALMYKMGINGTWINAAQLDINELGANICTSGSSLFSFNSSFSSTEDLFFRLVAWGEDPMQVKFGKLRISGSVTTQLPGFQEIMMLKSTGKVVIGDTSVITTPGSYGLYVQEGILTEAVKVSLRNSSEWSDDAWDRVPQTSEVEKSIKENAHLPAMPSADQLVKEGYELKAMDARLLEQIEWLWLKVIALEKENERLTKRELNNTNNTSN